MFHRVPSNSIEWFPCLHLPPIFVRCRKKEFKRCTPFSKKPSCSSCSGEFLQVLRLNRKHHVSICFIHFPSHRSDRIPSSEFLPDPDLNLPAENPCHLNLAQSPVQQGRRSRGEGQRQYEKCDGYKECQKSLLERKGVPKFAKKSMAISSPYPGCPSQRSQNTHMDDSEDLDRTTKIRMKRFPLDWHSGHSR